jgi:phenylpropionate dioxygenase-like ring-hydroxylating dioxygenase large terminal subunit
MSSFHSLASSPSQARLLDDEESVARIFRHIDNGTTDLGEMVWREPVEHYHSQSRFDAEIDLLRRLPIPFCPSAALPKTGSYIARKAALTPLLVTRGADGKVRAFINACRHRGMQVADGSGCSAAFVCPYHAWTYGLEGQLKNIPGPEAFPDVDKAENGLVEVSAAEKGGIIYVMQVGQIEPSMLDNHLDFFTDTQEMFQNSERQEAANWKLLTETTLEGYHIKSLHKKSFFPFGLDNINLVETIGANSRIIFPFRRIETLRDIEPSKRHLNGAMTSLYHLFPNASVSVLSKHTSLAIMEPISPSQTRLVSYFVINRQTDGDEISLEDAQRDAEFVTTSGLDEDIEAARAIQETVSGPANTHLTFGYFEKAIVNLHSHLAMHLDPEA